MEFHVTPAQRDLQHRARCLAADFATRAAQHDREASDPVENYAALRDAGFYGLNVPAELGGAGVGLLGWSLAAEELAQGCASTALSFNMHLSVVGPMMESPLVPRATRERLAKMVVHEGKLISGNFSEPTTSGLVGTSVPLTRARRVDGGYRITGRKAFASMIAVADHVMVLARPDDATSNAAAMFLLVPPDAPGRRVDLVWDTLGMRHPQRLHDARGVLRARRGAAAPDGGRPAVPARWRQLVLGVLHARVPRHRRRGVSRHQRDREGPYATRLHAVARLSPRRPAPGGRDECRPGGRAPPDALRGLAQRHPGPDAGDLVGALPGQVLRGRGGHPSHADGHDLGGCPRAVQDVAPRAILSRRSRRPRPVPSSRFLPVDARHVRAGPRSGGRAAAVEERPPRHRAGRPLVDAPAACIAAGRPRSGVAAPLTSLARSFREGDARKGGALRSREASSPSPDREPEADPWLSTPRPVHGWLPEIYFR